MRLLSIIIVSSLLLAGVNKGSEVPTGKPEAMIDLASASGVALIKGDWRYSDTRIVEVDFVGQARTNSRPARLSKHTTTRRMRVARILTIRSGK